MNFNRKNYNLSPKIGGIEQKGGLLLCIVSHGALNSLVAC